MALPDLIEIVPLEKPVKAEITVPGSKSITNRALILAALAEGEVTLTGALWSEDTQIMVECLQKLGFEIKVEKDPEEFCNRTITVKGLGGKIPNSGTEEKPLELFVGNAGTAARFLAAFVCLGDGVYRLSGVPRMHERPQEALFKALRKLGYRVESGNEKLPATILGEGHKSGGCEVSIEESSQFASALLLCAKTGGWTIQVVGENAEESPYVAMTLKLIEAFPHKGGKFQIEPDASSGSYFWAINFLIGAKIDKQPNVTTRIFPPIRIISWPKKWRQVDRFWIWQIDMCFPSFFPLPAQISRKTDLGDSIMTAIVLAPFNRKIVKFTDLGRLRLQECDRVMALRTELNKCGVEILEHDETLTVFPSRLHGAEIETYNDHRMAMCFAVLGLKVPGIKIRNPACVKKTFPNFFQKLADAPPRGLGATILDGNTGRKLTHEELFAD
jgi:3-phosphoshikimate 1-carboxyvinyltransferase